MADDDGGISFIPIGPTSGTAARSVQFASETADFLRKFAKNPAALIISVVSAFVVSVVLEFFGFLVGAVLYPFDLLVGALQWVQVGLSVSFAWLGIDILELLVQFQRSFVAVVESSGPAGPLLAMAIGAVILVGVYRLLLALAVAFPGGDSLLTLLNLR